MKIVYLASLLTYHGVEHLGRSLAGHLSTEHELEVYGAIVKPDSDLLNGRVSLVNSRACADSKVLRLCPTI